MKVADMFPNLRGRVDLAFVEPSPAVLEACDAVFFATPNGTAMKMVPELLAAGVRVIDLAADFRLGDPAEWQQWYGMAHACPELLAEAVYGLPEVNREAIRAARLVANPGCYPTAVQLGFLPLIEAGLIEPLLIVAIDNAAEKRADEYLPFKVKDPDGSEAGGEADAYARMVIDEVKPFIDRTYRTKRDARNTGLGGASYGAIVSLYMGLRYPTVFGKLALVSPSLWWDDGVMLKQVEALPGKRDQRYWIDLGTSEGDTMRPADARALGKLLEKKGWKPGKDLAVYIDGFAIHREDAWARRFPLILMFLFGRS